jgi:hypothetical protein
MYIEESVNTNFVYLQIDNYLNWKNHIDVAHDMQLDLCYIPAVVTLSNYFVLPIFML